MFSPLGYPNGKVVYDFLVSPDEIDGLDTLYDLEPYRQTFAVFAVTSFTPELNNANLDKRIKDMRARFPSAIVHKIIVFGVPNAEALQCESRHIVPVLSSKGASFTSLETAMCDITSDFLAELAVYAISRRMGSFKSPNMKSLDSGGSVAAPVSVQRGYHGSLRRSILNTSRGSTSKNGSMSLGLTDRSKSKQNGRSVKFMGNMYLLAGRVSDALREFTEAATILKAAYDHLWHGSALDGIGVCLVLQAFLEVPFNIPTIAVNATLHSSDYQSHSQEHLPGSSGSSRPGSPISRPQSAGSISQTPPPLAAKGKSMTQDVIPTHLMQTSHTLQGFLPDLTEAILRLYNRSGEEPCPQTVYCDTILRITKLLALSRTGGGWNGAVLSGIVRDSELTYNITSDSPSAQDIGYWCNKLFSLNLSEWGLVSQCRVLIGVATIHSGLRQHRKASYYLREIVTKIIPTRSTTPTELEQIEKVVNMIRLSFTSLESFLEVVATTYAGGSLDAVGCRWNEVSLSFLRTCFQLCQAVKDHCAVIFFGSQMLQSAADSLSPEDQFKIMSAIRRAQEYGNRLGAPEADTLPRYWDRYILRDIRVVSFPETVPVFLSSVTAGMQKSGSVFLYDPILGRVSGTAADKKGDDDDARLVENERSAFIVRLQNPFEFEVKVESIHLATEPQDLVDTDMLTQGLMILPPMSVHEIMIAGTPKSAENVALIGAKIKVSGCSEGMYYLVQREFKGIASCAKIKQIGSLQGTGMVQEQKETEVRLRKTISLTITPQQPLVIAQFVEISQGWLSLLDGETRKLRIRVSNTSNVLADTLYFTYSDSSTDSIQAALSYKDLSPADIYDLEYALTNFETLKPSLEKNCSRLEPNAHEDFEFNILGKRGLSSANIVLNYGSNGTSVEKSQVFLRRCNLALNVTVSSSIEIAGMEISSWKDVLGEIGPRIRWKNTDSETKRKTIALIVDLRNCWSEQLNVDLTSNIASVETSISAGSTVRVCLPISWVNEGPYALREIPSLSKRQYIHDQTMTGERARYTRENFWLREQLLQNVTARWSTETDHRNGSIDLRGLRLTREMVNLLKEDEIKVGISVYNDSKTMQDDKYQTSVDDTTTVICAKVCNNSSKPVSGILHIYPSVSDGSSIDNRVLFTGSSDRVVQEIEPGHSFEVQFGVLFLTRGVFEWTSAMDVTEESMRVAQQEPIYIEVA